MQFSRPFLQAITLFLSLFIFSALFAHEVRPAIVDLNLDDKGQYQLSIKLNLEALISNDGSEHQDTDDSNNADIYNALREMQAEDLAQKFLMFESGFLEKIQLSFDGKPQTIEVNDILIPDVGDLDLARDSTLNFKGAIPAGAKNLSWKWDASFGNAAFRVSSLKVPEVYSAYLKEGKPSELVLIEGLYSSDIDCNDPEKVKKWGGCASTSSAQVLSTSSQTSWWTTLTNYIAIGFDHIIPKGLDHILFVVGLFLLSTQLRPLLIQITSFTLAHSVTLALGIFGVISISPAIVEPLIAASIVYVCIENIFADKLSRWRPFLVFLFGLLHGLGFASVLTEFGLAKSNYISGLIGFNLGVELGQLAVIAICFIAVGYWFGNKSWYRQRITIPASIIIAMIAVYWFIDRVGIL